jgi:hypothetical protein
LRLALLYAGVFAVGSALLFGFLYWTLTGALNDREQATVERRATELAELYARGGPALLRARLDRDAAGGGRAFFVRVLRPDNSLVLVSVPPDWIETQVERLPFPGLIVTRPTYTVRIPQDALRDYAIAGVTLPDRNFLQAGILIESQTVLFAPLRRAFALAGGGALILSWRGAPRARSAPWRRPPAASSRRVTSPPACPGAPAGASWPSLCGS